MATRVYKMYAATGAAAGIASCTIGSTGRIRAIQWCAGGLNAADVTGREHCQLCLNQSATSVTTNDTAGYDLSAVQVGSNIASSISVSHTTVQGLDIPVKTGDRLILNSAVAVGGSALSSRAFTCYIYVDE